MSDAVLWDLSEKLKFLKLMTCGTHHGRMMFRHRSNQLLGIKGVGVASNVGQALK
jgi:hypothetical protein